MDAMRGKTVNTAVLPGFCETECGGGSGSSGGSGGMPSDVIATMAVLLAKNLPCRLCSI